MKRYFYAAAYAVIAGCLLATLLLMIPSIIVDVIQGKMKLVDIFQTILLLPFIAGAVGCLLAGLPVVLTGFTMALFDRLPVLLFLLATVIIAVLLEFGYCFLLQIKAHFIPVILIVTAFTTLCLCLFWRFWLILRIK